MDLFEAASLGQVDALRSALESGQDPDARDAAYDESEEKNLRRRVNMMGEFALAGRKLARTALHHGAGGGHLEAVDLLLAAGATVDGVDALGMTPLMVAVEEGKVAVARRLIRAGADVNGKNGFGQPLLTQAIAAEHPDIAWTLIEAGAKVEPNVKARHIPLLVALQEQRCDAELLELLLSRGADASRKGVLEAAMPSCSRQLIERLIRAGADPVGTTSGGEPLVHWALTCSRYELLDVFLLPGVDLNGGDGSVLMKPCHEGKLEVVRRLIAAGADVNRPINDSGETPLMRSCDSHFGNLEVLDVLIEAGADLERRDRYDRTALNIALEHGNEVAARPTTSFGKTASGWSASPPRARISTMTGMKRTMRTKRTGRKMRRRTRTTTSSTSTSTRSSSPPCDRSTSQESRTRSPSPTSSSSPRMLSRRFSGSVGTRKASSGSATLGASRPKT